jgi:hypothetical protein
MRWPLRKKKPRGKKTRQMAQGRDFRVHSYSSFFDLVRRHQITSYEAVRAGVAAHLQHHRKTGGQDHMAPDCSDWPHTHTHKRRHFLRSEHALVRTSCDDTLALCVLSYRSLCDKECNGFYLHGNSRHIVADDVRNTWNSLEFPEYL